MSHAQADCVETSISSEICGSDWVATGRLAGFRRLSADCTWKAASHTSLEQKSIFWLGSGQHGLKTFPECTLVLVPARPT